MNLQIEYVLNYFRQIYQLPLEFDIGYGTTDRKVNIYNCKTHYFDTTDSYPNGWVVWKEWKNKRIPFLFPNKHELPILEIKNEQAFIHYDILKSAFFFLSGWQEYLFMHKYSSPRYPYQNSLQNKLNITHIPVVNYYFDILKTAIEKTCNITLKIHAWNEYPFGICLTHDIDQITTGWRQEAFHLIKKGRFLPAVNVMLRKILNKDVWFNLTDIVNIEKRYSANSSFYFLARRGRIYLHQNNWQHLNNDKLFKIQQPLEKGDFYQLSPLSLFWGYTQTLRNADYRIKDKALQNTFQQIRAAGSEVGIHESFDSHIAANSILEDIQRFPFPVMGGRFHFLFFDSLRTFKVLEQTQLKYDSTLGFAEEIGFRNGICFPFVPFNISENKPYSIGEIPLMIMDTTFWSYKKNGIERIFPQILNLVDEVQKFNGCLVILWHNKYFSPYKFAGWGEIYEQILAEGQKRNALLLSSEQVYQRWQPFLEKLYTK